MITTVILFDIQYCAVKNPIRSMNVVSFAQ